MILIDMNQIAVANLMMNLKMNNSKTIDESMVRHMILNSIRMYRMEHHDEYGEVALLGTRNIRGEEITSQNIKRVVEKVERSQT